MLSACFLGKKEVKTAESGNSLDLNKQGDEELEGAKELSEKTDLDRLEKWVADVEKLRTRRDKMQQEKVNFFTKRKFKRLERKEYRILRKVRKYAVKHPQTIQNKAARKRMKKNKKRAKKRNKQMFGR